MMKSIDLILSALISLLFLMIVFIPLERVFPAKKQQSVFRPGWFLDLCFFFGQYLFWGGIIVWIMNHFSDHLLQIIPNQIQLFIQQQHWVLQALEVFIFSDLFIYWGHRLQHKIDFLWKFHKVHHTVKHLDWLAAHREHPLDSIYTIGIINLPAFILGFPLETIAGIIAFRGIWAIYIHSNVRIPMKYIRAIIGAPELHHWHHELSRDAGNYANISPLMDIIFGTYICPDKEPERFGIEEETPNHYLGLLIEPLIPKSLWNRIDQFLKNST